MPLAADRYEGAELPWAKILIDAIWRFKDWVFLITEVPIVSGTLGIGEGTDFRCSLSRSGGIAVDVGRGVRQRGTRIGIAAEASGGTCLTRPGEVVADFVSDL